MKKRIIVMVAVLLVGVFQSMRTQAQSISDLLEQLALDYQKLDGLKSILNEMYQGYEIVSKGYNAVKGVSQGNFTLQQAFLDGMLLVSPTVRKYPRVQDIISDQSTMIGEYKSNYNTFKQDKHFSPDEISYMMDVYNNLVNESIRNLDALTMVMSDNKLRMSDAERLQLIDRIYSDGHGQLTFMRQFNNHTRSVGLQRSEALDDQATLQKIYGIN